jgi:hypothetical protein
MRRWITLALCALFASRTTLAAQVLVEAEAFDDKGGWVHDAQFLDVMGSPYLMAHGLGKPVSNAVTTVRFPESGAYRVWVRTKDWVEEPEWAPGRFEVIVDGKTLDHEFGVTGGGRWLWQPGGTVEIAGRAVSLELRDLTGFNGRCDAILFTTDADSVPSETSDGKMREWRKTLLGIPDEPVDAGRFDVVVVGGGVSGCSAAVAAARLGCRVALIQNRPVFGGNNSSEIGVWGPRWGIASPFITSEVYGKRGSKGEKHYRAGDAGRQKVLDAEPGIKQFAGWHAFGVETAANRIVYVDAVNVLTARELRFSAPIFIDCTGDGSIGHRAGADFRYGEEGRNENNESLAPEKGSRMVLGATLHWRAQLGDEAVSFPEVPWALAVSKGKAATGGAWQWEYGHNRDMIHEAEEIRDYLFRSIYGSFATAKKNAPEKLANSELGHVAYILGKRESRRLVGDYIMTQMDCWDTPNKSDRVAISNNPFDVHKPNDDYDFNIYVDHHYGGLGRRKDADIPFRSLYSRNISNLLMAGRCISVTHIAHSSTRVMNTGSQTGIATGSAAYLCVLHNVSPRVLGKKHIAELQDIVFGKGEHVGALSPR